VQQTGSGGFGAVSFGISDGLIGLIILAVVVFAVWKLAKLLWAAFTN
jgi:hypothetical protein